MIASIAAICRARHGVLKVDSGVDIGAVTALGHVPIGLGEVPLAACDYPIVLIKDSATGGFRLMVLLSLDGDANLFMIGANWVATYLPLNVLRLPFCLGAPDGAGLVACVDEASRLLNSESGAPLFDADGAETTFLVERRALLNRMRADSEAATEFVSTVVAARIVRPLTLALHFEDRRQQDIEGAYTIDPVALETLPDDSLLALHRSGHLSVVYALVQSLAQVNRLEQLHNARGGSRIIECTTQIHL